jgi:hypothetical protein
VSTDRGVRCVLYARPPLELYLRSLWNEAGDVIEQPFVSRDPFASRLGESRILRSAFNGSLAETSIDL